MDRRAEDNASSPSDDSIAPLWIAVPNSKKHSTKRASRKACGDRPADGKTAKVSAATSDNVCDGDKIAGLKGGGNAVCLGCAETSNQKTECITPLARMPK
jgi:hypothetical protein